jgi:type IV pilus assembly protein PilA
MLQSKKAFTLIELMIVVAIIGILAAIAVPNFVKFQCRSKQSEAKGNLKALYVSQEAFRAESDTYASIPPIAAGLVAGTASTVVNSIGFVPKGGKLRYTYNATGNNISFGATADASSGAIADAVDEWTITQLNDLKNTNNACD